MFHPLVIENVRFRIRRAVLTKHCQGLTIMKSDFVLALLTALKTEKEKKCSSVFLALASLKTGKEKIFFGTDFPENRKRKEMLGAHRNHTTCRSKSGFFYERQEHRGARQPAVRDTRKQSQGPISVPGSVSVS